MYPYALKLSTLVCKTRPARSHAGALLENENITVSLTLCATALEFKKLLLMRRGIHSCDNLLSITNGDTKQRSIRTMLNVKGS